MSTTLPAHRVANRARRIGYRLLPGDGFSYLLHMRPREWLVVTGHMLFGFFLSLAADAPDAAAWARVPTGLFIFVILLNGGTLAINSAFDRDEGDVGYLDAPPPPPRYLFLFGLLLMLAGQVAAVALLPLQFGLAYAICFAMSVLYSVPPFRWKAVAGLDLVINAVGFGFLTPLAGWTLTGRDLPFWGLAILVGFGPLFAALYPLTQFYQLGEDAARGDRTLASMLGLATSLRFALAMVLVAFVLIGWGVSRAPGVGMWPLVALPAAAWASLLLRWLQNHEKMSPAEHKQGMYRALQIWALTNAVVLAAVFL